MSGSPRNLSLPDLPVELIEKTLTYIHPLNVVLCRQINKVIKEVVDSSVELQFRIELACDGYLVNNRGSRPAKELLQSVLETRVAFESLTPSWTWTVAAPNSRYDHYELCDGTWGRCMDRTDNLPFRAIHYEELAPPKLSPNRWTCPVPDTGMEVIDFSYWLAADLQILMESRHHGSSRRIHFRTISTNTPHPQAARPFFEFNLFQCPVWRYCLTLTGEEYVVILFSDFETLGNIFIRKGGALVVNWQTGAVALPYTPACDIAFLSHDTVLLLRDGRDGPFGMEVYSLTCGRTLLTLTFPQSLYIPYRMRFLTHPPYGSASPAAQADLFTPDPQVDILPIDFKIRHPRGPAFFVVLSLHRLRRKISEISTQDPPPPVISWEDWGPDVTRWLPADQLLNTGFRSTYGSRMLAIGNLDEETLDAPQRLEDKLIVFDFNPRPIRRMQARSYGREHLYVVVEKERTCWKSPLLDTEVRSSVPVRAFVSRRSCVFLDIHLDANTLICRRDAFYSVYSFLPRDVSAYPYEEEESLDIL